VGDWTDQLDEAFDFQRPERLVRFVRAAELDPDQVELIFAFDDPRYNLSLAIDERFGVRRPPKKRKRTRLGTLPTLAKSAASRTPHKSVTRLAGSSAQEFLQARL
jgi:hypothetical protein